MCATGINRRPMPRLRKWVHLENDIRRVHLDLTVALDVPCCTPNNRCWWLDAMRFVHGFEHLPAQEIRFTNERLAVIKQQQTHSLTNLAGNAFAVPACIVALYVQHGVVAALEAALCTGTLRFPLGNPFATAAAAVPTGAPTVPVVEPGESALAAVFDESDDD